MTRSGTIVAAFALFVVLCGLGILYDSNGKKGIPRTFVGADKVLLERAENGDAEAQCRLASIYYNEAGAQHYAKAAAWYHRAADQGYAKAQSDLGVMYQQGLGVRKDYTEATRWYRKAADQGYASAQFNLGTMYYNGEGVPQDYSKALEWWRKAADQGHDRAQSYIAFSYVQGKGVPQEYTEAARWYRKAADHGNISAEYALGTMYRKGQGIPKDYSEAIRWYRKAGESGNSDAKYALIIMFCDGQRVKLAQHWTFVVIVLLGIVVLVVPKSRWGFATWVPNALMSILFAMVMVRELVGTRWSGLTRISLITLSAAGSALFALIAFRQTGGGVKEAQRRRFRA